MNAPRQRLFPLALVALFASASALGQQPDDRKAARERELARRAQAQVQKLEGEKSQLQTENTQLQKDKGELEQKLKSAGQLRRQVDEARRREQATEKELADLKDRLAKAEARVAEQQARIETLTGAVAAGKAEAAKLTESLAETTRERDRRGNLAEERARAIEVLEEKNLALYGLAMDMADRYQRKGVWAAITQKEPVTGIQDVRMQAVLQEYRDKVQAQRVPDKAAAP
jgi:chromosome segregation ATPase